MTRSGHWNPAGEPAGHDHIGTPGYTHERAAHAPSSRPVPPRPAEAQGYFRIRTAIAITAAAYPWAWTLGIVNSPLWTTIGTASAALRLARKSLDPDASRRSIITARIAQTTAGLYLAYVIPVAVIAYRNSGFVGLLTFLLTS